MRFDTNVLRALAVIRFPRLLFLTIVGLQVQLRFVGKAQKSNLCPSCLRNLIVGLLFYVPNPVFQQESRVVCWLDKCIGGQKFMYLN
jgi:hypothetical protein